MKSERSILLDGVWKPDDVQIRRVPITFDPTEEQKKIVQDEWFKKPADAQDLPLWRFEGLSRNGSSLELTVSLCTYRWHFILRNQSYPKHDDYPNPLSATTLMHTSDNKLVLGIRKGSDQGNTLHAVGGGFIDPLKDKDNQFYPESPFETSAREITEETTLKTNDFSKEDFRMFGLVWGNNHDTTCVIHAPVKAEAEEIEINAPEHSELVIVDVDPSSIQDIISQGYHKDWTSMPATDHLILSLKLFLSKAIAK